MFDVRTRFPAAGKHQHCLGQHRAPVMGRCPLTTMGNGRRQRITQAEPVSKGPKKMQTNIGGDLITTGVPPHVDRAATVHLADALLLETLDDSTTPESRPGGHLGG